MVEPTPSKDAFLVEHTDFSLREKIKYPNGGTSNFYDNGKDMVIIDKDICAHNSSDPVFSYMLITDKQNNYMHQSNRVFRFLGYSHLEVDKYLSKNEIVMPINPTRNVGDRSEQSDVSPLELHFEKSFSNAYGMNALKYITREYGICDENGKNYFLDYFVRTKDEKYAVEENGVTYHHPQIIGEEKYKNQLRKQNTCASWGIKLFRFSTEDCAFENRIEDDIKQYFGNDPSNFIDNGLKIDRSVELYEHQSISLQEIQKRRAALSERLNLRGYRTLALSGEDSQEKREDAIDRLVSNTRSDYLQYILTVDIFNEGVDIPEINQVVLLRPTQSPIVFVQQLGRGLRKSQDKEYVVILDFIGNYKNNFMIPIALSGDRSYNKDNIRRYVLEGERIIPGSSTIHFDEISKKQIFASIDTANFADIKLIKDSYKNLKNKLGRIPTLMDFETYGEIDVQRIFDNKSLGSYYAFLKKYEKDYKVRLNGLEESFIKFICTKLANGKRKIELEILSNILEDKIDIFPNNLSKNEYTNVFNIFTNEFPTGSGKNTFKDCIFIEDTKISKPFKTCLENNEFKSMVKEIIEYALDQYNKHFKNTYKDTNFVLYQKYTYEDACRLLNWQHNEVPLNIGGYKYDQTTKTFPVFINYDKANDIQDTIKYEDHFINESQFIAISKSGRTTSSDDVQNFLYAKERGIEVHLFVRKNKDDKTSKEFYYLGNMQAEIEKTKQFMMPNTQKTAVEILWQLDTPVREDIYRYIVEE